MQVHVYKSVDNHLQIYCCDIYKFHNEIKGHNDMGWDRAALTVINVEERPAYKNIITGVCAEKYLIEVFEYDKKKD